MTRELAPSPRVAAAARQNVPIAVNGIRTGSELPAVDGLIRTEAPKPIYGTLADLLDLARATGAEELRLRAGGTTITITTDAP